MDIIVIKCSVIPCSIQSESYVFISYAHDDARVVFPIIEAVNAQGYDIWYDKGINISSTWTDEIANAIIGCKAFVIFITKNSMASKYVRSEIEFALNKDYKIIPVYLEGMDVLPSGLALGLNATQGIEEKDPVVIVEKICAALEYNSIKKQSDVQSKRIKLKKHNGQSNLKKYIIAGAAVVVIMLGSILAYTALSNKDGNNADNNSIQSNLPTESVSDQPAKSEEPDVNQKSQTFQPELEDTTANTETIDDEAAIETVETVPEPPVQNTGLFAEDVIAFYDEGLDAENRGDYFAAYSAYKAAADKDYTPAMNKLANMYFLERGSQADIDETYQWYQKSADLGDSYAMAMLGELYEFGMGKVVNDENDRQPDIAKAVELYRQSADLGDPRGMALLGDVYRRGYKCLLDIYIPNMEIEKDYTKALELIKKSADMGDPLGTALLGIMYNNGQGVEKDSQKALMLYMDAANKGNARALNSLGFMYENGNEVKKDEKRAAELFQQSADLGYRGALYNLGSMYEKGTGVARDYNKAVEFYRQAYALGSADACGLLGYMYHTGKGVEKNIYLGVKCSKQAADLGSGVGMYNYGISLLDGAEEATLDKNLSKAKDYFEASNAVGYTDAKAQLEKLIRQGY